MFRNTKPQRRFRPIIETLEARRLLSTFGDFNGDGFDDMAIGVPGEDLGSVADAGAVHVLYGTSTGLTVTGTQFWTQDSTGVVDTAEAGDEFGLALASGDFNNDGRADLAIGVQGESFGSITGAGAVQILYGSATGLTATANQLFHQDSPRVREINEIGDAFGTALATGDVNGDGFTDLVIGTPYENVNAAQDAGAISVFLGSPGGITPVGNQNFNLDSPNMQGAAAFHDLFGLRLAVGDFNNDGRDDVAIGAPDKDIDDAVGVAEFAGAVSVMLGSANGLTTANNNLWHEGVVGVDSNPNGYDRFGWAVAAGDFNNDGRDDLAISVPFESVGISIGAGAIHVFYGSNGGLTVNSEQFLDQNDAGGNVELNDYFGYTIVAADFNGDGRDDLAVGSTNEKDGVFGPSGAGCVNVMYGSAGGLTSSGAVEIFQEDLGTGEISEYEDFFGDTLAAGDFNGNGRSDLMIATGFEDIGETIINAGRAWTLYGTATGFTGGQSWGQDTPGIDGGSETDDYFGFGLDASGGKSAPGSGRDPRQAVLLITADVDDDSPVTKAGNRRLLSGRR